MLSQLHLTRPDWGLSQPYLVYICHDFPPTRPENPTRTRRYLVRFHHIHHHHDHYLHYRAFFLHPSHPVVDEAARTSLAWLAWCRCAAPRLKSPTTAPNIIWWGNVSGLRECVTVFTVCTAARALGNRSMAGLRLLPPAFLRPAVAALGPVQFALRPPPTPLPQKNNITPLPLVCRRRPSNARTD